jgi:hypothetical protein
MPRVEVPKQIKERFAHFRKEKVSFFTLNGRTQFDKCGFRLDGRSLEEKLKE